MNWVDLALIAVVGVSAMLSFMRGFVREALGIMAWAGAGYVSYVGIDYVRVPVRDMIGSPEMGDIVAHATLFLAGLLALTILAGTIAQLFHNLGLGAVDRTLGVVFGAVRGMALVVVAFIGAGWVTVPERWPEPVRQARMLPVVGDAAGWVAERMPARFRPNVPVLPAQAATRALDLMQAVPLGRTPPRP